MEILSQPALKLQNLPLQPKKKKMKKGGYPQEREDAEAGVKPDTEVVDHYAKQNINFSSLTNVMCICREHQ